MNKQKLEIAPISLAEQLQKGLSWKIIDVRELEEWNICHLAGACLISLGEFRQQAIEVLDKGERIVLYCHHGVRSEHAQSYLIENGYSDVWNLEGGIDRWAQEVDSAMPRY